MYLRNIDYILNESTDSIVGEFLVHRCKQCLRVTRMSMSARTNYVDSGKRVIPTGESEQVSLLLTQGNRRHLRATQSLFSGYRHNSFRI